MSNAAPDPLADPLAGLDPEQRLAAEALSGPVVVLAGAGTGKTRAITHRIAHAVTTGRHDPATGLAVTFTTRAAGEMRGRLAELGVGSVAVRTFHAAALAQLRHFWPTAVGGPMPPLVPSKVRLVGTAARQLGIPSAPGVLRDLAAEIEWSAATLITPGEYPNAAANAGRSPVGTGSTALDHAAVAQVIAAYQQVKADENVIDFDDVLLSMIAMLGERPDIAEQVRGRYRWFTVDEYQDITPAQERLLAGWLGERDDVCVVGDPSQTIYSFAGADPDALARFARTWPNATEVRLDRCYRCTPQIVAVANALIRRAAAPATPVLLRSQRPAGPVPAVVTCADEAEEAATVATRIGELAEAGMAYRDMAVLIRINAASEPIEAALAEAGIPYVLRGGERFFDRAEVREAVVRLRGEAGVRVEPGSEGRSGDGSADEPEDLPARVVGVLTSMGWATEGPVGGGTARERWESLAALVALAHDVAAGGASTMGALLAELDRRAQLAHAPTADGVTLATLHAAKGLEWPAVFVTGAAEGTLPIVYADTPERVEEERRLLYVGLTRARDLLVVTWPMARAGRSRPRQPSRFLADLRVRGRQAPVAATGGLVRAGGTRATPRRRGRPPERCRVCGAALVTAPERTLGRCRGCPGSASEHVTDRLRQWRLETSRAAEKPAFVIFTDVTLIALAERMPTTHDELLEIPGIGPAKAIAYGPALLELLAETAPPPS